MMAGTVFIFSKHLEMYVSWFILQCSKTLLTLLLLACLLTDLLNYLPT